MTDRGRGRMFKAVRRHVLGVISSSSRVPYKLLPRNKAFFAFQTIPSPSSLIAAQRLGDMQNAAGRVERDNKQHICIDRMKSYLRGAGFLTQDQECKSGRRRQIVRALVIVWIGFDVR